MAQKRIAVITGASRGLGLALAKEFAANGWQVIGTGRSALAGETTGNFSYQQFDASDAAACEKFWQEASAAHPGTAFCLVNNAGGYIGGSLVQTTPEDYAGQMQSCYFTAVYMTRGLALVVPKARIINIISTGALVPHKDNSAYGAAKAAEMHFFQALQKELKPEQYQITNLYPSDIASAEPNPKAIDPNDLARFVREQAETAASFYLRDATLGTSPQ